MKRYRVGYNLTKADLNKLICFVLEYFSYLNTSFYVEKLKGRNDRYNLWWSMSDEEHDELCKKYMRTL